MFLGTIDGRLFSLYAENGKLDDSFGTGGWVDLRKGVADDFPKAKMGMTSGPVVYKNLVICGSLVPDGEPLGPAGDVRAYDTSTGKLMWTFHTVARAGEFGNDTWADGSRENRGGANAWPPMSVDLERGILFIPLTSPATDFYGGDRKGAGLFGDSLVAVDAATGKRLWHFQTVHHNLWDYDLPAQPVLVQVRKNGKLIDAVAQVTKTGFTFVFDRVTGEPVFPIEEVPVPASEIPGESAWPTQPRPVKPPPYARQSMTADELGNVTSGNARLLQQADRRRRVRVDLHAGRIQADGAVSRDQRRRQLGRRVLRSGDPHAVRELDGRRHALPHGEAAGRIRQSLTVRKDWARQIRASGIRT